jgi:tetratricopeptide (TPR) repeat protein
MTLHENISNKFNEGMHAFAGGDYRKAEGVMTEVLIHDPDHKLAYTARGSARLQLEEFESAIDDLTTAIEIDADYARAYHLRGLAFKKQGKNDEALADFNLAIEANPEYGAAYYSRATLLAEMGKEDAATSDIEMVAHLTNQNIETFANENNVWRSQHLKLEQMMENELNR